MDGSAEVASSSTADPETLRKPPEEVKLTDQATSAAAPIIAFPSDDEDDEGDDEDDPLYPNGHLQILRLHTPPPSAQPIKDTSPDTDPPLRSPARRPRLSAYLTSPPASCSLLLSPPSLDRTPPPASSSAAASASASTAAPTAPFAPQSEPCPKPPSPPSHPSHPALACASTALSSSTEPAASTSAPLAPSSDPPMASFSLDDIQARIRTISRDPTLSEAEKNHQRQAILSHQFHQRRKKDALAFKKQKDTESKKISYSNVTDPATGRKMPGCEHYPRNCKIKADCCGLWVVCRLCHDHPSMDHAIDRFRTKEVMCMLCFSVQPVSRNCVNPACKIEFAHYFCDKCKFFDNTPGKDIYHCPKCKICRVGKGIGHDNFHCDRCDACVSREYSKNHRCLKKSLDANCPICGLYLFTSTKPVVFMRCGHTMHSHCFDVYTAEHYICPLCHKALTNMRPYYAQIDEAVRREVMPVEHRNKVSEVLCHDCDKRSVTPYHFLYLKCMTPKCGSYNTRPLRTFKREDGAAAVPGGGSTSADHAQREVDGHDDDEELDNDDDDDDMDDSSMDEG